MTTDARAPAGPIGGRYCYGTCDAQPSDWTGFSGQTLYLPDALGPGMDRTRLVWSKHEGHGGSEYWHLYLLAPINEPSDLDGDSWLTASPDPSFAQPGWESAADAVVPLTIGRGKVTWGNHALTAFHDGLLGATGSGNSGDTFPVLQLPAGTVPTALAVTPNNELCVVTLWDPQACSSTLAVVALHDRGQPWMFPSQGFFQAMKLLGTVDLGDLRAPTAVAVTRTRESALCHTPTHVATGRGAASRDLMVFTCRGDRSVVLVSPTGEILATLLDDRISDPVTASMSDTRGASVLSVGDFGGRRLLNYLNGPIDAWGEAIFGELPEDARFEFAGALDLAGSVVAVSAAEVP
jgi:hypothetical protein